MPPRYNPFALRHYAIVFLAAPLVLGLFLPSFTAGNAHAGITEVVGGRADLELAIFTEEEYDDEAGPVWKYATEENIALAQDDTEKIPYIFDRVVAPILHSFSEKHSQQLEDRYVDRINVNFNLQTNTVGIVAFTNIVESQGRVSTWVGEATELKDGQMLQMLSPLPDDINATATKEFLSIFNAFTVTIPAQFTYDADRPSPPSTYGELHWKALIPNASARIAYLSEQVRDTISKHRGEITSNATGDGNGAGMGKVVDSIQVTMFEDMARVTIDSYDQGASKTSHVTEYYTALDFIVPSPRYLPQGLEAGEPIHFAKPATKNLTTKVEARIQLSNLSLFSGNAMIVYPDGRVASVPQSGTETDGYDYGAIIYSLDLGPEEPVGLYSVLVQAENPERISYINVDVAEDPPIIVPSTITIQVGGKQSDNALPIDIIEQHTMPRYSSINEMRVWLMAPSWKTISPDNYQPYLNVTDINGNDLLDHSKQISLRDALVTAQLVCRPDQRELRTSVAIDIPLARNVTAGEAVLVKYPVARLAPEHDGSYNLTFSTPYDADVELPNNMTWTHLSPTTVTSRSNDLCQIADPEQYGGRFAYAYAYDVSFLLGGKGQE